MNTSHLCPAGLLTALAVTAGLALGCGSDDTTAGKVSVEMPHTAMSAADAASVDKVVKAAWQTDKQNIPALYVGVWDPKKGVFTKAYGAAADGVPATTGDSFRIGSISKAYTATVVLQLVDEGKLSLDDTVSDVAPNVAKAFPAVADRTIGQLLGMRSGISDYADGKGGIVKEIAARPDRVWNPDELIAAGIRRGVAPAGKAGSYSTTNYILLQEIAEEITGSALADLIKAKVTARLGLQKTFLPPNDDTTLPEPAAHSSVTPSCKGDFLSAGANVKVGTDLTDWSASYGQGGGGMTSSLGDLGTWAASGTGDVLLPTKLVKRRNTTTTLDDGLDYGLGVVRLGSWYGHLGEALGWESLAIRDPKTGVIIALAGNSCGISSTFFAITQALYPDAPLTG